jgi:hypothetical protein
LRAALWRGEFGLIGAGLGLTKLHKRAQRSSQSATGSWKPYRLLRLKTFGEILSFADPRKDDRGKIIS